MEHGELLTVAQAAEQSGITDSGIRKAIRRGDLTYSKQYGVILIAPLDLKAYRDTVKMGPKKNGDNRQSSE